MLSIHKPCVAATALVGHTLCEVLLMTAPFLIVILKGNAVLLQCEYSWICVTAEY